MATNRTGVMIKFNAQPGRGDALADHLAQSADLAQDEPGTELWIVHRSPTDPDTVWVYEVYASDAARAAHEATDAYQKAREGTGALLGGPPEVIPLIPVGGKGLG